MSKRETVMIQRLLLFLTRLKGLPETPPEVRETVAYKAGYDAERRGDDTNPHAPGTDWHLHWAMGHRDSREYQFSIW